MQTVTTVGFGDIPPRSNAERLFAILFMIIGLFYLKLHYKF